MIYIILIAFTLCWYLFTEVLPISKKEQRLCFLIPVFLFAALIMGLRSNQVGADTVSYAEAFNHIKHYSLDQSFKLLRFEPGWILSSWVIAHLGLSFISFQLLYALCFAVLSIKIIIKADDIIRNHDYLIMTLVIFVSIYLLAFNAARQMLAVLLTTYGFLLFNNGKLIKGLIFAAISFSIHYSSLLFLPIYFFNFIASKRFFSVIVLSSLTILYLTLDIIFQYFIQAGIYAKFLNNGFNEFQVANTSKMIWVLVLILSVYILFTKHSNSFSKICAFGCLIYSGSNFMSSQINYAERIAWYFIPFVALIYAVFGKLVTNRSIELIYRIAINTIYVVWFVMASSTQQYKYSLSIII